MVWSGLVMWAQLVRRDGCCLLEDHLRYRSLAIYRSRLSPARSLGMPDDPSYPLFIVLIDGTSGEHTVCTYIR